MHEYWETALIFSLASLSDRVSLPLVSANAMVEEEVCETTQFPAHGLIGVAG